MTKLVGILNITPDSFSDGGVYFDPATALVGAAKLFEAGASLIDVGAESTWPQATPLAPGEEWPRLSVVLPALLVRYPGKISLDSFHPGTIERAYAAGPVIMNDVTGFNDPEMRALAVKLGARVIVSHLPNMTIREAHRLAPVSTAEEVKTDLLATATALEKAGLPHDHIILDPGIGFGKTMDLNWELLKFGAVVPDYPVMIGYSKKRFLGEQRWDAATNLAAGRIAVDYGAAYLRVHDVAAHRSLIKA